MWLDWVETMATVLVQNGVPKARKHVVCERSVRNKRLRLKTLGAFTLKVVLSSYVFVLNPFPRRWGHGLSLHQESTRGGVCQE